MEKFNLEKKISSPKEELSFLKDNILEREMANMKNENPVDRDTAIQDVVDEYTKKVPEHVFERGAVIPEKFRDEIVLRLRPEEHDTKMAELVSIVYEKGNSIRQNIASHLVRGFIWVRSKKRRY